METSDDTEVLVVGGGATGVGVARDLAMRGVDVTLTERGGLSAGTTGRSHGVLHSGARYAEADRAGAEECIAENETLREIAGVCVADTGGYFVSLSDDDEAYFERKLAAAREVGIDAEEVSVEAAREAVPGLTDDVTRAMRVPDGVVYPSRLVAATAADAREHGAEIRTHAPVEEIHTADGRVTGATVDGDRVDADAVVNATGAWAGECAALAGVDVAMRPTKGAMVGVDYEGLGPVLNRCRDPADGDIAVPHRGRAVLGTTSVVVDDPDEYDEESWEVERVVDECAEMVPAFADAEIRSTYWGVRPLYEPDETHRGAGSRSADDAATGDERGISREFALLDHDPDGVAGFYSIVGGKLTTHRVMAEATADRVCERLGVDADCRTADAPLVGADDAERVDGFVDEFDARSPADADVVGGEPGDGE
ncbi:FAD-dependent oxidoreductase [Candidatus Halobonum tyrrellensis]|uniref:Glycerol-3-phosphate dehydrogenase n=1 Tax=Candidatus Halobonum tyrrellensis G22 TaxID=1324957 RepID=V4HA96_9EURY|nr:FAD-dependent oxidoreductase [Candidatus Halobonum tyrrellensis]ESP87635.1 glycerol-3-phosphate dehydrogenase [Candidatus Halobonum tyrrellensis G22]